MNKGESKENLLELSSITKAKNLVIFEKSTDLKCFKFFFKELLNDEKSKLVDLLEASQPDSKAIQNIFNRATAINLLFRARMKEAAILAFAQALETNQTLKVLLLRFGDKISDTAVKALAS